MSRATKSSWQQFGLGLCVVIVAVLGVLLLGHAARAAITVENVGGSLGLGTADLKETIVNILKWVLGLLGLVAVSVVLYGGFLWLTSRGNQQQIDKAKRVLINGAIGIVIILVAWAIVLFVQRFITNATEGNAQQAGCVVGGPTPQCTICVDTPPVGDGFGTLQPDPDPLCTGNQSKQYYATWEDPTPAATDVKLCQEVSGAFGGLPAGRNDADPASVLAVANCVNGNCGNNPTPVTGTLSVNNNVVTFSHAIDFAASSTYTVDVTKVLSNLDKTYASLPIPPDGWTFKTGTTSDKNPPNVLEEYPRQGSQLECLSPVIEVRFNESMSPPSVFNKANLRLTAADGGEVPGIARIDMPTPNRMQVRLDKPLRKSMTFTVTLSADNGSDTTKGYRDTCSNALDCGNDVPGKCTSDNTSTGDPNDNFKWTFSTKETDTVDCTPKITSVSSTVYHGSSTDPKLMTIKGTNFGTSPNVRFTGNVVATWNPGAASLCFAATKLPNQVTSPQCVASVNVDQNTGEDVIQTIVPTGPLTYTPTGAATGPVTVELSDISSPPSQNVTNGSPHVNWISPREGKAGQYVTIGGSNFGAGGIVRLRRDDGTSVQAVAPSCAQSSWTDSQILIQIPEGFAIGEHAYVQVCGKNDATCANVQNVSNPARYDFQDVDGPQLCNLNPTSSNDGAAGLTADGRGFGTNEGDVTIYYGAYSGTLDTGTLTDTQLGAHPSGKLANGAYLFTVKVGGRFSNPLTYTIPKDPAPEVVQDSSCSTTDPARTSPNPTPDSTNICWNAGIAVRFTTAMFTGTAPTYAGGTLDPTLTTVQACGTGATFDPAACSGSVAGTRAASTYTNANDRLRFTPNTHLTENTWYQVTVRRGMHATDANGPTVAQDFTWHFRTRPQAADCTVEVVGVEPPHPAPLQTNDTVQFVATGYTNSCTFVTGAYSFTDPWQTTDTTLTGTPTSSTTQGHANDTATITVPQGPNNGTAYLKATTGTVTGQAQIDVVRNYCDQNTDCNTKWDPTNSFRCAISTCDLASHRCTPYVHDVQNSSGPAGDIVNVNGCYFGNSKGNGDVVFTNGNTSANGTFDICGPAGWTDGSIRVQAQPENATDTSVWGVTVRTNEALQSNVGITYTIANQCYTPTHQTTTLPTNGKPIVCSVTPNPAKEKQSVTYFGSNFTTTGGNTYFTSPSAPQNNFPLTGTGTTMTTTLATSAVPGGAGIPSDNTPSQTTVGVPNSTNTATCVATPLNFNIACTQNSECASSCCSGGNGGTGICQPTALCTSGLINSVSPAGGTLTCRNVQFHVNFAKLMRQETLNSTTIILEQDNGGLPQPISATLTSYDVPAGQQPAHTVTDITPAQPLGDGQYFIRFKGSATGIVAADNTFLASDFDYPSGKYTVQAGTPVCTIARVDIQRGGSAISSDTFLCSGSNCQVNGVTDDFNSTATGNQHGYNAYAYDANNIPLAVTAQAWTQADTSGSGSPSNVYQGGEATAPCKGNATNPGDTYCGTSLNVASGTENLTVKLTGTTGAGEGTRTIPITSFLCANPWPANGLPFADPSVGGADQASHDFTFAVCRDKNPQHTLSNPVQGQPAGNVVKEYFLFVQDANNGNANTGDAIGVRIVRNAADFSPLRWYQYTFGKDPSGSTTEIDGYPAIREGRTVYVAADFNNYPANGRSAPYIYVFSYTDKASATTVSMFETLLQNLHLNAPLLASGNPTDLTLYNNLRADIKRVHAYEEIIYALEGYKAAHGGVYPTLGTGTYLPYYSFTSWPSWQQTLGAALGISPPRDPVTKWDTTWAGSPCTGTNVDPNTCWDDVAKHMYFPNDASEPPHSNGIGVRYIAAPAATNSVVDLFGTASNHFWAHISNFTKAYSAYNNTLCGYSGGPIPRSTNVCPTGSQCQGFNLALCSEKFVDIVAERTKHDTVAPTLTLVSPAPNTTLTGQVEIIARATDNVGIARVNFVFQNSGGTQQATAAVATPGSDGLYHWTFSTRQFPNGSGYRLTGIASDTSGNTSTQATATYSIQNPPGDPTPPIITLVNPNTSTTLTGTVTLTANATDNQTYDTGIAKVEFYFGTSKVGTSTCSSNCQNTFVASVGGVDTTQFPNGAYTYSVVAYDVYGNTSIRQLNLQLQNGSGGGNAPNVVIVYPTSSMSGTSTNVVADVQDRSGQGIDRVTFTVGNEPSPRAIVTSAPYTYTWPLTGYTDGTSYTIRVDAYDRAGNHGYAARSITYTVVTGPDTERPVISNVNAQFADSSIHPLDGATLSEVVRIQAALTDNVNLLRYELYIDNQLVPLTGTDVTCSTPSNCTLNHAWNTLAESTGPHTVAITVYDGANNATTVPANVDVSNKVIMTITSPTQGATVKDGYCSNKTTQSCTADSQCGQATYICTTNNQECDTPTDPTCPGKCILRSGAGTCVQATVLSIAVSKTCRTDQLLSQVQLYADSSSTPFATITNCTNGKCTYNWSSKTTVSNGTHVISAIGTDSLGCMGGAKVGVVVQNQVNDTTPPTITEFSFRGNTWGTGTPVYINNGGPITVQAQDNSGGSGLATIGIAVRDSNGNPGPNTSCSTSPCQLNWSPVDGANYTVTVTASDIAGNAATPKTQIVSVDTAPPIIAWSSPASGSTVTNPITLQATSSDPQRNGYASGVAGVTFFQDAQTPPALVPTDTSGNSGTYSWSGAATPGVDELFHAEALDRANNKAISQDVFLTVQGVDTTPPNVSITTPNVDGYYQRGTFTTYASAWDPESGVRDVQFYLDGAPLGGPDSVPSYTADINTASMADGSLHTITAKACNKASTPLCATSAPRTFVVYNGADNICGNLICSGATPSCCGGPPWVCQTTSQSCSQQGGGGF